MNNDLENIINILKELMKFKSISANKAVILEILKYIKGLIPDNLYIEEYEFENYPALVISNTKEKYFDLVFCTHVDVVPCEKYECIETEFDICGRGSFDMKGSLAVCIHTLQNSKTDSKIALFITSDEEISGNCAKELLKIYSAKFAVVPDGGNDFDLIVEEKGLLQLKIICDTISAHAGEPYNGENAITKLMDIYQNLVHEYPLPINLADYKTSICLSKIIGGDVINKVASHAEMYLDIRHTEEDSKESIVDFISSVDSALKIEVIEKGEIFKTETNNKYVKQYISCARKILKNKIKFSTLGTTSDAVYFYKNNIPTVIMNPIGKSPHGINESVNKESLLNLYKIYQEYIKLYL